MKHTRVFVGLSGGVDSSVAAKLLVDAGYDVVGVFIRTWHPDFLPCTEEQDRLDAMRVAAHLGIPFITFDAVDAYKQHVADYMISEYRQGRTPNPDVMCNEFVKFGVFLDFARSHGAHKIATGHYARIEKHDDVYQLYRGTDPQKDQSYFLWRLSQEELKDVLFPIGSMHKREVRHLADRARLRTSMKPDSQGICFLGEVDMYEFLRAYIPLEAGAVLNVRGERIGTHQGALVYTLGQRHGFVVENTGAAVGPLYVVERDLERNILVVAPEPRMVHAADRVEIHAYNQIGIPCPPHAEAQWRYRQTPFPVAVTFPTIDRAILTTTSTNVDVPAGGQSCVLYDGAICIGGGIVC